MRKIIFLWCTLFVISIPALSQGETQGSVTVNPQGGVTVDVNKTPPAPVVIDRRPIVVEKPVVVERQPVVNSTVVEESPRSGCSLARDARPASAFVTIGALLFFGFGTWASRRVRQPLQAKP